MDSLVEQYLSASNAFDFNYSYNSKDGLGDYIYDHGSEDFSEISNGSRPLDASSPSSSSEGDTPAEHGDPSDPMLKYISQMLMEEDDLTYKPCMFHDCSALQAAEKSFFDALNEPKTTILSFEPYGGTADSPSGDSSQTYCSHSSVDDSSSDVHPSVDSNWVPYQMGPESSVSYPSSQPILQSHELLLSSTYSFLDAARERDESLMTLLRASNSSIGTTFGLESIGSRGEGFVPTSNKIANTSSESEKRTYSNDDVVVVEKVERNHSPTGSGTKKTHYREDSAEEHRSNKQIANSTDDSVPQEMYDNVLLCPTWNPNMEPGPFFCSSEKAPKDEGKAERSKGSSRGRPRGGGGKKQSAKKEVVDLRGLLVQCAQAVASYDVRTTNELLARIRQHSSAHGDGMERLAHYFSIALEARLAGTGTTLYNTGYRTRRISAADILKGYQMLVAAIPFKKVVNMFGNRNIGKLVSGGATRLHIIDFGILYGFQWPCLIQRLSEIPEGPPMLCITGIDLPQPGLRPAERVEETGFRLQRYCERFGVPFAYHAIAKKWESIKLEDFKIDRGEVLVVNCMDRLANVPDETVIENCPRDAVLNLIKRLRPSIFIQNVINGTYNSPFFVTRFREALFHFSALFDMFETTVPRENEERALVEKEILARDALNVIACEGTERVERPETYRQWQVRNLRAGFRQLPLDEEIVKLIRDKVKTHYHRDFSVDEDGKWMLQGWKGRVMQAISCWEPLE